MSVDATKVAFSSGWDIDQLLSTVEVAVGVGTTAVATIPSTALLNTYEVNFNPGGAYWYQVGKSTTNATVATTIDVYAYLQSQTIYINTTATGTARCYIWADKVNY